MVTVLVAESNLKLRNNITNVLKNNFGTDCTVQGVKSRKEFFHAMERDDINMVLLDMEMPEIQWQEVTDFILHHRKDSIILPMAELSAFDETSIGDHPSVLDFLLKPYSEAELILTLEEAFHQRRLQTELRRSTGTAASEAGDASRIDIIRKKIERYIQEHYCEIISMQDVARAMNYSETHFCRLFKHCFQVNFSVYMNDFRVGKAKELLVNTNQTVKEVGIFCGYRDTSYFIRVFKRFTGMTPSDYRIHKLTMTAKKSNKS